MTTIVPFVTPINQISLAPGSAVTIPNVSWQEFEAILQQLGEHRSARLNYNKGILEIMVPLPEQEKPKELIADIVKTLLKKQEEDMNLLAQLPSEKKGQQELNPMLVFISKIINE